MRAHLHNIKVSVPSGLVSLAETHIRAVVQQYNSPPLMGGDKGEGENTHLIHPHPDPPPSRGRRYSSDVIIPVSVVCPSPAEAFPLPSADITPARGDWVTLLRYVAQVRWLSCLIYLFMFIWSFTSCATVWEAQRVRQDVKELREYVDSIKDNDLKLLKENTEKDLADLRQKQADLLVQIDETKTKIMEIQGEIDQLTKANDDLKKELEATREILNSIQEDLKKTAEKPKDEEELYKQGLALYNAKEYQKARETFKTIMDNFPNGKYVDNAHYWSGECYYSEGNFLRAIDEYGVVIEKFPNSPKRPAALLKAGMAFQELKRKKEAGAFYLRVTNEYSKSEQAGIARKKLEKIK